MNLKLVEFIIETENFLFLATLAIDRPNIYIIANQQLNTYLYSTMA